MMKKLIPWMIFTISLLVTCSVHVSLAQDEREKNAEVVQVMQTLQSPFLTLHLQGDVSIPGKNIQLPIYSTDYAQANKADWLHMFFGDSKAAVKDELLGWDLEELNVFYPELEHRYSAGSITTAYVAYDVRLNADFKGYVDIAEDWDGAQKDKQQKGLNTTPAAAIQMAEEWMERLSDTIGWDQFETEACYAMPTTLAGVTDMVFEECYVVEFRRMLGDVPVAFDKPPYQDETKANIYGDIVHVYINDEGVFRIRGHVRSYEFKGEEQLTISLEEAIDIVQNNMDYTIFSQPSYEITQIGLCYRLVQRLETHDKDVRARVEARPAWRFASAVNRNMFYEFVMFVDAVTGEVLP